MFKKDLTAIGKGPIHKHEGKGAQSTTLPNRGALNALSAPNAGLNDFSKATPMPGPSAPPPMPPGSMPGGL